MAIGKMAAQMCIEELHRCVRSQLWNQMYRFLVANLFYLDPLDHGRSMPLHLQGDVNTVDIHQCLSLLYF